MSAFTASILYAQCTPMLHVLFTCSQRILIVREPKTWQEAKDHCLSQRGHLFEPRTWAQKSDAKTIHSELGNRWYWVGGSDLAHEGNWRWLSDNAAVDRFSYWASNEGGNHRNKDCMYMGWCCLGQKACNLKAPFACVLH